VPPTDAPASTPIPTITLIPTEIPTAIPVAPTTAPVTSNNPTYTDVSGRKRVDPAWYPCKEGQVKANNDSGIFHIPTGRSYAFTFVNVTCFDTADAATAAGFTQAQQ
jgi:hypothetical protein